MMTQGQGGVAKQAPQAGLLEGRQAEEALRQLQDMRVDFLRQQRADLVGQLGALNDQRRDVVRDMMRSSGGRRAMYQDQLAQIDMRADMVQTHIHEAERQIAEVLTGVPQPPLPARPPAPAPVIAVPPGGRGFGGGGIDEDTVFGLIAGQTVIFALMLFMVSRWITRRVQASLPDRSQELARLQQAVDVIAVEVERISENQRYVTKVLGAGAAGDMSSAKVAVESEALRK